MNQKQRQKMLKRLAHSSEGEALKEKFEELIGRLTDSRNYKPEEFEMEGKSSLKAAAVLQKIMKDLELLKKSKKERQKNPYI